MTALPIVQINGAVEGPIDRAVLQRIVGHLGAELAEVRVKFGKERVLAGLEGYNSAARFAPWIILVDFDDDPGGVPSFVRRWLPAPHARICFRVAVREVEAWLLADRQHAATFLGLSPAKIPPNPDSVPDPKQLLVNLARRSSITAVKRGLVPRVGSGRKVGDDYTKLMRQFALTMWDVDAAARNSASLRRALACVARLIVVARTVEAL